MTDPAMEAATLCVIDFLVFHEKDTCTGQYFAFIDTFTNMHSNWMVSVQLCRLARLTKTRITTGAFP